MNIMINRFVHGGNIYDEKSPTGKWLDYSANINPLGISKKVKKTIVKNIDNLTHYPDPTGKEVKYEISNFYKVPEESIVLGNGAVELLYIFFHAIRPQKVLLPIPSFSEYERAALSAGSDIAYFSLPAENNFSLNIDELLLKIPFFNAVILGNPNNPTGNLLKNTDIERLLKKAEKSSTMIIIDESFIDFLENDTPYTSRYFIKTYKNLFLLQSLTKFYALPGLRLGFSITSPNIVEKLEFSKDVWNMNLLAQKSVITALNDEEYQNNSKKIIKRELTFLVNELKNIKEIQVISPSVNFILLNIKNTKYKSYELVEEMKKYGILIRDCNNYPGLNENYVRIAVKNNYNNKILIKTLASILKKR